MTTDHDFMTKAIFLACRAKHSGSSPFGTVIVDGGGHVIAEAFGTGTDTCPTKHSEMKAIEFACRVQGGLLHNCTMYQTHEPCHMCCGAIKHSKLGRLVYGTSRVQLPAYFRPYQVSTSTLSVLLDTSAPPAISGGVLLDECKALWDDVPPTYKQLNPPRVSPMEPWPSPAQLMEEMRRQSPPERITGGVLLTNDLSDARLRWDEGASLL